MRNIITEVTKKVKKNLLVLPKNYQPFAKIILDFWAVFFYNTQYEKICKQTVDNDRTQSPTG